MRVLINYIWLLIFVLGGQHLHAAENNAVLSDFSSFGFIKKEQLRLKTAETGHILLEELGVDLDEEFHSLDETKSENGQKYITDKFNLLERWFIGSQIVEQSYKNSLIFTPDSTNNVPIYLKIGVLRI